MKLTLRALCLVIGLALAGGGIGADAGDAGSREPAQPVADVPPRPAADGVPETSGNAGESAAPASADDALPAKRPEKSADARQSAQRDNLWLLLLQVLRSPR